MTHSSRSHQKWRAPSHTEVTSEFQASEPQPRSASCGIRVSTSQELDDPSSPGSLETKHSQLVLGEQGSETALSETLGTEAQADIVSTVDEAKRQYEHIQDVEAQCQSHGVCEEHEVSNASALQPTLSSNRSHCKKKGKRRSKRRSVRSAEQSATVDAAPALDDQILSSATLYENEFHGRVRLLQDNREFTRAVAQAISNYQQDFPIVDSPLPRIHQRQNYEVEISHATKSVLKKKLSPAAKNLLNFEKGGALALDYHVYTVLHRKGDKSQILYTAMGSLEDNVLVLDKVSDDTDRISKKPLAPEIAFDAWLWIPPSVKPDDATTEDIKQLRLIVEQDDALQFETPLLDFLAGKLFEAGEFKPCQPIRLSAMSESQLREDCFYLLSSTPGLERITEMLRKHNKMLGGSWPSEIHILKMDGRWARLTILQRTVPSHCHGPRLV